MREKVIPDMTYSPDAKTWACLTNPVHHILTVEMGESKCSLTSPLGV